MIASHGEDARFLGRTPREVLLVEDNPMNVRLMEGIVMQFENVHLTAVGTGELGLEYARKKHPNLILMDIQLPGIDGITALKTLREDETTRDIPVVAVSANATPNDVARGNLAGFEDYVTKPISVPMFLAVLGRYLGHAA